MKKIISIILVVLLSLTVCSTFIGCGDKKVDNGTGATSNAKQRYTYTDGVHDMTAPERDDYLVKNGKTEYVIVVPAGASSNVELAVDEFKVLFKRATNISIPSIIDNSGDPILEDENAKRISIGETNLLPENKDEWVSFGYDKSILRSDGVRIITKNNTIYILGGNLYGTLNAVYDFMQICFNYEFYYRNCIEINTNVQNLKMRNFNVTDIPDIETRSYGNNVSLFKDAWEFELESGFVDATDISRAMRRYRYVNPSQELFLPIYEEKGNYILNYGYHNVYYYVHPNMKEGVWRNSWLSDNAPTNNPQFQELCYTAHGSEEDLQALIDACVDKIQYSLSMEQWKNRKYVGFTIMDGGFQCNCKDCEAAKELDGGSYAGAIIRVANRIMEKVKEWMANNGQGERELYLFFLAYGTTEKAPVKYSEEKQAYVPANDSVVCREDVVADICTHNYSSSIYYATDENQQDIEEIIKWRAVSKYQFNWFYQQRYVLYSAYFDTFSMLNNDMYAYVMQNGGMFAINQGDYRGESVTGWGILNEYVYSKLMWDVTLDLETIVKKYFNAMFKDAADTMYEIFMSEREHSMNVTQEAGGYNYSKPNKASLYPYKAYLLPIIEKYEKALSEIEVLKQTNPAEYELVRQRINSEYVAPLYLALSFYGSKDVRPFSNGTKLEYKARLMEIAGSMQFLVKESSTGMIDMYDFAKGV